MKAAKLSALIKKKNLNIARLVCCSEILSYNVNKVDSIAVEENQLKGRF